MAQQSERPIRRLLVANRGEIATRIISSVRELGIESFAIYVSGDVSHALKANHAIEVSAADFMNIQALISIVTQHGIDAVHPGYGFLSESEDFAKQVWEQTGAVVIGPGWEILERTGDKLKARSLAEECNVPVCPALKTPTNNVEHVREFATKVGYPIMVKAVDGGGGRGIRLIKDEDSLPSAVKRAAEESPSKQIFAEKAAINGFRHVEVQVIGDGTGNVTHLWERECSIQRRYQKIVEFAPSLVKDRQIIATVIQDALRMAKHIRYRSLGTFEFLVNPNTKEHFFLEVNPRLQVEHTVTESISMADIVRAQILLAQGSSLADCGLRNEIRDPLLPPRAHSIQLRITAENVHSDWSLSIGKITSFQFPTGNGIRVDTHLVAGHQSIVSADFDSLIAKLIITASSWPDAVRKASRALDDTLIVGVKTNVDMLRGIVAHPDFLAGNCDTRWLETNHSGLLSLGCDHKLPAPSIPQKELSQHSSTAPAVAAANVTFRKGDAWELALTSPSDARNDSARPYHLELTRVLRNEFPQSLVAELLFTSPATSSIAKPHSVPYTISLSGTSSSASAATSHHRRGNPSDGSHVIIPFPGKLVEVLVDEGDTVKEGDVICVVQQMKMELEVRSHRSGRVGWIMEIEDGEEVGEGMLAAVVEGDSAAKL
ncbi:hypothetical protein BU24DRAFT_473819 [Aaosphaeria arxii CBS 175.79]|uniref:Uncharacterized protein n=1 Tax=Aaosphaeria arxii CBS 175.79 TaxID=1450172 RepID=A0A6A5XA52_9PLEO|nr:uncharacterized protein BU24DRAFT_473819 [Aaosphaeria arxii CBS 175.79]KAF2009644.1 hypothetical protein BU24DRAFT_473819 [Aaosphaeria arxii CBS 175.79]